MSLKESDDDDDLKDMFGSDDSESSENNGNNHVDQDLVDMFGSHDDSTTISSNVNEEHSCALHKNNNDQFTKQNKTGMTEENGRAEERIRKKNSSENEASSTAAVTSSTELKRRRSAEAILQNQKRKKSQERIQRPSQASKGTKATSSTKQKIQHSRPVSSSTFYRSVTMEQYWNNILEWNLVSELNAAQQLQKHPRLGEDFDTASALEASQGKLNNTKSTKKMEPLPETFQSTQEYKARWAPLLLEEVRSQFLSQVTSDLVPSWAKGAAMTSVLVEPVGTGTATTANSRINRYETQTLIIRSTQSTNHAAIIPDGPLFVNDVLLLVDDARHLFDAAQGTLPPDEQLRGVLCMATNTVQRSIDGLKVKVSSRKWKKIAQREMLLAKIGSNVTSLREFTALFNMESILLKDALLRGVTPGKEEEIAALGESLLSEGGGDNALGVGFRIYIKSKFNPSQIEAICAAASEYGQGGFTLVKGPPGTGKTTTLVALLNALHLRQYQIYHQEIERIATQKSNNNSDFAENTKARDMAALQEAARVKPRILVCAPSNAAVDNVILKITQDRFVDGNGGRYSPSIVRVGARQSSQVNNVSLQTQIDAVLGEGTDQVKLEGAIASCRKELNLLTNEIQKLQRRLRAIVRAAPYPLSRDWEIRIDEATYERTGRALFVNHMLKETTYNIPPPAPPDEGQNPPEGMPHYRSLMDALVTYVGKHNTTSLKLSQYILVQRSNKCIAKSGRHSQSSAMLMEELETHLIDSAHIVLTTLGSAGSKKIQSAQKFAVVVVDEAAQSSEPASLVALELGSSHAVLMGDPQQLPATIFSVSGRHTKFDRSLFQRLEEAGHPVHMLDTQYRMDPAISEFPRKIFYDGRLLDGANVRSAQYGGVLRKTISAKFSHFKPFTIFDLDSAEERDGTSLSNTDEADLALCLYGTIEKQTNEMLSKCQVAIITPYSQQVALLKQQFSNFFGQANLQPPSTIEISTIDAFQGKEADVVIFSCVRASSKEGDHGIGFLSDVKRMNVALTRAKHYLFVIAKVSSIVVNPYWHDLVQQARRQQSVLRIPFVIERHAAHDQQSGTHVMNRFPDLASLIP